jgi:hypothetical protein
VNGAFVGRLVETCGCAKATACAPPGQLSFVEVVSIPPPVRCDRVVFFNIPKNSTKKPDEMVDGSGVICCPTI